MMKSCLKIRTSDMAVNIQMNNHNFLRWAMLAIEVNTTLVTSLAKDSKVSSVFLTDSSYLLANPVQIINLAKNTHIILLDGINSYLELVEKQSSIATRSDLRFFVVGWLSGLMMEQTISIHQFYPTLLPDKLKRWGALLPSGHKFYAPYRYRILTSFFSLVRYFKNWIAEPKLHGELNSGRKVVFCGLVIPNDHQVSGFFRGVDAPTLLKESLNLTKLNYLDSPSLIEVAAKSIIEAIKTSRLQTATDLACAYSILNVLHRIMTLSILNASKIDLFVNEARSNHWIDPYDSFFYRNNFYLDFGSTRGRDAIYPRTIDMFMKNKHYTSLRFLPDNLTIAEYIAELSYDAFFERCEMDAKSVGLRYQKMFS